MTNCQGKKADGNRCTRPGKHDGYCWQHRKGGVKAGKRPGLTERVHGEIMLHLSAGTTVKDACALAGISESAYYKWQEVGEADLAAGKTSRYAEFVEGITHARAKARATAVVHVRRAMPDDWRAAAWYLERTDFNNWGRRERQEISGPEGGPVEYQHIPTEEDFHRQAAQLLAEAGALDT